MCLDLEKRGLRSVCTPDQLEAAIESRLPEVELFTLSFEEYLGMRGFLGKPAEPVAQSFRAWLRFGGFPKAVGYDDEAAKARYVQDVVGQIVQKDIRARRQIRNRSTFERVMAYVINSFGAPANLTGIAAYLRNTQGLAIKRETLAGYIDLLVAAKVLYRCSRFDVKSRRSLQGGEKYYLADTGIYFARNVGATPNYGPLLENVTYACLRSRDFNVSVGAVGKLELDFNRPARGRLLRLRAGADVRRGPGRRGAGVPPVQERARQLALLPAHARPAARGEGRREAPQPHGADGAGRWPGVRHMGASLGHKTIEMTG